MVDENFAITVGYNGFVGKVNLTIPQYNILEKITNTQTWPQYLLTPFGGGNPNLNAVYFKDYTT